MHFLVVFRANIDAVRSPDTGGPFSDLDAETRLSLGRWIFNQMQAGRIRQMNSEQFDLYQMVNEVRGQIIGRKLKAEEERHALAGTKPESASMGNRIAYNDAVDAGADVRDFAGGAAKSYRRPLGDPHPRKGKGRSHSNSGSAADSVGSERGPKPSARSGKPTVEPKSRSRGCVRGSGIAQGKGKGKGSPRSRSRGRTRGGGMHKGKGKARR
jgi:hypothetical protein